MTCKIFKKHCSQKWSLPLRISSVNVTKSAGNSFTFYIWPFYIMHERINKITETHSELCSTSKMDISCVNSSFQSWTVFTKSSFCNVWQWSTPLGQIWKMIGSRPHIVPELQKDFFLSNLSFLKFSGSQRVKDHN